MKTLLRTGMSMLALAGMLMVTAPSYALPVDVTVSAGDAEIDPLVNGGAAGTLTLTMLGLPTVATSDATVTVTVLLAQLGMSATNMDPISSEQRLFRWPC